MANELFTRNLSSIQKALDNGVDINATNSEGETALTYVAYYGCMEIVKFLIRKGADLDKAQGENGATPLTNALLNNQLETAKYLVTRGANPNAFNADGTTALIKLCTQFKNYLEGIKLLTSIGVNVCKPDTKNGNSPLWWAVNRNRHADVVEHLLENGAYLTAPFCFFDAIELENLNIVKMLVKSGADANVDNGKDGCTVLTKAIIHTEDVNYVKELIAAGADVNKKDGNGKTPLIASVETGQHEIVKVLLRKNPIKINDAVYHGNFPVLKAIAIRNTEMVKSLLKAGAEPC